MGRIFTLSVSFADSSPRVGAKGWPELGQALGHHDRPPSCGSPLASPFGRSTQCAHWAERAFLPSQSLCDSSPRVGAKGRSELGQAFGHHDRPPSCGSPLASPFGRGAPDGAERVFFPSQSASLTAPPEWEPRDGQNSGGHSVITTGPHLAAAPLPLPLGEVPSAHTGRRGQSVESARRRRLRRRKAQAAGWMRKCQSWS